MTNIEPPKFVPVDLTELADGGVLYHANELFFWPLGLALTWTRDGDGTGPGTGPCEDLHVRQWEYPDGHRESIADLNQEDGVKESRDRGFFKWMIARVRLLPVDEQSGALKILARCGLLGVEKEDAS